MSFPDPKSDIEDYYEITQEVLGQGYFAVVKVGVDKKTKERVAIKFVKKSLVEKEETLTNEIQILSKIDHPSIVKMKAVFDTEETLFIVMELMLGGELYEEIVKRKTFSEKDASDIMKQLFSALAYLHKMGIVHRDLKLENLLLVAPSTLEVKLADFGLSKMLALDGEAITACGTPFYVAPDILKGIGYDSAVDMWATGILLYVLLSGRLPFAADSDTELFKLILAGNVVWKSPQFDTVSDEAKDLISNLIVVEPSDRLTAENALKHPFITGNRSKTPLPDLFFEDIKQTSNLNKEMIKKKQAESKEDAFSDSE